MGFPAIRQVLLRRRTALWLPVVLTAVLVIPFLAYTPDDTYIHAQFARNIMNGDGFSFNPGEPTYGATSPLWVLLVATGGLIPIDYVVMAKILSVLCTLGTIAAFAWLARSLFDESIFVVGSTLAWSVDCWLLRWAASGMETSLSLLLLLVGIGFYRRERKAARAVSAFPIFLALLTLVRPEGFLLFVIVLLDLAVLVRRRWTALLVMSATYLAVLAPWTLYASWRLGTIVPNTYLAKSTLSLPGVEGWLFSAASVVKHMISNRLVELILIAAGMALAVKNRTVDPRSRARGGSWLPVAVAWIIFLPAVYVWRGIPIVSRYLLPVTPLIILLGFRGLQAILDRPASGMFQRRNVLVMASVIGIMIQNGIVGWTVVYPHTRMFSRGMGECLIPIGQWFARETPSRTSIAALDIGALGYYSQRNVVDLGGLVTPRILSWLHTYSSEEMAEIYPRLEGDIPRADYIVNRSKQPEDLGARFPYYEHLFTRQMGSLGISADPGETHYTVYRIRWEKVNGGIRRPQ